jgi:hypothetical protein
VIRLVACFSQQTRIATTETDLSLSADEKLTAFLEPERQLSEEAEWWSATTESFVSDILKFVRHRYLLELVSSGDR